MEEPKPEPGGGDWTCLRRHTLRIFKSSVQNRLRRIRPSPKQKQYKKTKKQQKQTQKHHRPSLQASPPRSVRLIFTGAVYPFCISDSSAYTRAQFVTPPSRSDPARFVSDRVTVLAARPAATSDRRREPLRHRVTDRVMSPEGLSQIISRHQHPPPKNIETSRLPPRTAT
jgi:hypothetical protein